MCVWKSVSCEDLLRRGSIKDGDVRNLRRALLEDGTLHEEDAERLLEINRSCPVQSPSWAGFYVPTLADYLINQVEPEGFLTVDKARWLIFRISADGRVRTRLEFELLIGVLTRARWLPASLVAFALAQVRDTALYGDGPLRAGEPAVAGVIRDSEVALVRRILCAFGGGSAIAVTRPEAEILLEINDAVSRAPANPAWTDLFAKAMANIVLTTAGYAPPARAAALEAHIWCDGRLDLLAGATVDDIVTASLRSVKDAYASPSLEERAVARLERQRIEIVTREEVAEGDGRWLARRLFGGGRLSAAEEALVGFLARESPIVHHLISRPARHGGRAA